MLERMSLPSTFPPLLSLFGMWAYLQLFLNLHDPFLKNLHGSRCSYSQLGFVHRPCRKKRHGMLLRLPSLFLCRSPFLFGPGGLFATSTTICFPWTWRPLKLRRSRSCCLSIMTIAYRLLSWSFRTSFVMATSSRSATKFPKRFFTSSSMN